MKANQLLGCDAHEHDDRDYDAAQWLVQEATDAVYSLRHLSPPVWSQVGPSCSASAVAGAVAVVEGATRVPPADPPAPHFIYYGARRAKKPTGLLTAGGTSLRGCLAALAKLGCPNESEWPQSKVNLYRRPTFAAQLAANKRHGIAYRAIKQDGDERVKDVLRSLRARMPVAFGTAVAESFLTNSGPRVVHAPGPADPIAGRHAMVVIGAIKRRDRSGWEFEVRNSWGPGWRDDGHAWLHEDYIADARTDGLFIVTGAWKARGNR